MVLAKLKANWFRVLTHAGALLPLAVILWDYWQGSFVVDPIKEIITRTGKTALILLGLSLACTPINTVFGIKQVLQVRRALGLYAFLYASLHFLTFVGLDYQFNLDWVLSAVFEQRYTLVGFAALMVLLPLAITSTKGWQKWLGKRWKKLHRLVYLAGGLVIIHFLWLVKDGREPLYYGAGLAVLLLLRLPRVRKTVSGLRHRLKTGPQRLAGELDASTSG